MLEQLKKALVGKAIEDIGTVNRNGVRHAMIRLSGGVVIYAPWDEVESVVTTLRKPVGTALTLASAAGKLRTG